MNADIGAVAYLASVWILPILLAITFHEAAHGWVAWRLGDPTAKSLGRVSFNPFKHIDLWGTVLIPGILLLTRAPFLFGWAKPVPVNMRQFRRPRRDMAFVAAAGPLTNLFLAWVSAMAGALIVFNAAWCGRMVRAQSKQFDANKPHLSGLKHVAASAARWWASRGMALA